MKKVFISLLTFLWLSISFSSATAPTYQQFTYNLCNYSQWTSLSQIINSDFSQIQNNAWYNPVCYHISYNDSMSLYRFYLQWDYNAEYRWKYWYFDFWNCAGSLSDLIWYFDIVLSNWDSYMCSQVYWSLPVNIWFYYPYNLQDCSSCQSDLSQCQSDYNTCKSSVNSLSWSFATCQSDLAIATWNLAICQSDLNTCQNSSQCDYSWYILESEITTWYCETRFNLIEPSDCPNSSWSWEIMWSSFRVNNFQVMGGRNIYLYIPEWLDWDYTYVDENLQIEVENEGDEEYIQGIIDINSYRPSSEDFTNIFVSGLTLIMPYIVVVLFIIFVWKLIKKIFR